MAPYIDPINQSALDAIANEGIPPLEDIPIPELRKIFSQLQQHTPIPGVIETSFKVPFEGRHVEAFLFKPEGAKVPLPTILYLHGGAWVFGDVKDFDSICSELVLGTGFALVFVQYSLAPEKKFPTQQEECFAVAKFITKNGSKHGLKTDKIAVVGDSAGGQLAVAVSLLAQQSRPPPVVNIAHQVLICPAANLDFSKESKSEFEFFSGPLLDVPFLRKAVDLYIPNLKERQTPFASPVLLTKEEAATLPQSTVIVDAVDPLRSDGQKLGEILQEAGVDTVLLRGEGLIHDAYVLEATRKDPTALAIVGLICNRLKAALTPDATNGESSTVATKETAVETNGHRRKRTRRS